MDGTHVTALRTAAASAVSVKALAREGAAVLAVIGGGVQGRAHRAVVPLVQSFREVRSWSRSSSPEPLEQAVRGADVVCLCTDAAEPIVRAAWLSPGCHVTSVGMGAEAGLDLVAAASVFVEWRGAVTAKPPAGAVELQGLDPASVAELGEVLAGTRPGRRSQDEITFYKSTGHALEDAVAAGLVYRRALAQKAGVQVVL